MIKEIKIGTPKEWAHAIAEIHKNNVMSQYDEKDKALVYWYADGSGEGCYGVKQTIDLIREHAKTNEVSIESFIEARCGISIEQFKELERSELKLGDIITLKGMPGGQFFCEDKKGVQAKGPQQKVYVQVEVYGDISYEDDMDVPGEYEILLPADATNIESCALDSFHEQVAIKNLDEFNIWVEDEDGNTIEEGVDAPPSYQSAFRGEVEKIFADEDATPQSDAAFNALAQIKQRL